MKAETKFRIRCYLYYLAIEPWVSKFQVPNIRTLNLIVLVLAAFFKWRIILFITIFLAIVFHMIGELKSGKAIHWYRNYHYKKLRENNKELEKGKQVFDEVVSNQIKELNEDDKETNINTNNVS